MGGKGEGAAALCGLGSAVLSFSVMVMSSPTCRSCRQPRSVPALVAVDELVRCFRSPGSRLVGMHLGRRLEERLHDAPGLLDAVLPGEAHALPHERCVEQHLVW